VACRLGLTRFFRWTLPFLTFMAVRRAMMNLPMT
jgi:hypothetical protein